jgi:hypothetical protein
MKAGRKLAPGKLHTQKARLDGCTCKDCTTRRTYRRNYMKEKRAQAVEREAARMQALKDAYFALEIALYGPTTPNSSLNPKWFSAGGY